jgi:glycosyltransferase involved in cell wall biosynthesis
LDPSNRLGLETHLSRRGFDVELVYASKDESKYEAVPGMIIKRPLDLPGVVLATVRIPAVLELAYSLAVVLRFNRFFLTKASDVIWFHGSVFAAFFYLVLGRSRKPALIFTDGGPSPRHLSPWIARRISIFMHRIILESVDGVVFYGSEAFAQEMMRQFAIGKDKVLVSPPGINTKLFATDQPSTVTDQQSFIVLCVAGIVPRKNQLALLKAIPSINRRNCKAKFVFVGPILDAHYYDELRRFVDENNLQSITFTGRIAESKLLQWYSLADVVVLLTSGEGLAKTIVEAMSFGKAIVASSIPENVECARSGDEIIFVDPSDASQVASAVDFLLDNPEKRRELGMKAKRTADLWYDSVNVSDVMIDFADSTRKKHRMVNEAL